MLTVRMSVRVAMLGLAAGAMVALVSPPKALQAFEGCRCNDYDTGSYACNYVQTACVPGSEVCQLTCGS